MATNPTSDSAAFLEFLRVEVEAGRASRTPEEILRQWRERQSAASVASGGETAFDVLSRAGLLGCLDSGVGDLSTNKAHMEGFGKH